MPGQLEAALAQVNAGRPRDALTSLKALAGTLSRRAGVSVYVWARAQRCGPAAEAVAVYQQAVTRIRDATSISRPGRCRAGGRQSSRKPSGRAGRTGARGKESRRAEWPWSPAREAGRAATRRRRSPMLRSRSVECVLLDEPGECAAGTGDCRRRSRPTARARRRSALRRRRQRLGHVLVQTGSPRTRCRGSSAPCSARRTSTRPGSISASPFRRAARRRGRRRLSRDSRRRPAAFRARARGGERPAATGDKMIAPERVRLSASMSTEEHDRLSNINVVSSELLPTPEAVKRDLPLVAAAEDLSTAAGIPCAGFSTARTPGCSSSWGLVPFTIPRRRGNTRSA